MELPPLPPAPVATAQAPLAARVDALVARGQAEAALSLLQGATAPALVCRRGAALLASRRYEAAAGVYEGLLKRAPRESAAYYGLAWSWLARDQFGMALVPLREATRLAPGYGHGWRELGRVYYMLRRFEPAVEALERGLALLPGDAEAWRLLGLAQMQLGRHDAAETALKRAATLDAQDLLARRMLGELALEGKRPAEAERVLAQGLALAPDARIETLLFKSLMAQSKYVEAAQLWWSQRWRPAPQEASR